MSTVSYHQSFLFTTPTVQKQDTLSEKSTFSDKSTQKQQLSHRQEDVNQYGYSKTAMLSSMKHIDEAMVDNKEQTQTSTNEEGRYTQFLAQSNRLQERLTDSNFSQSIQDGVQNWNLAVAHELSKAQSDQSIEKHYELLNQVISLQQNMQKEAQIKAPVGQTFSSTTKSLSLTSQDDSYGNYEENNYQALLDTEDDIPADNNQQTDFPPPDPENINMYVIMLMLMTCSDIIVNNAISMQVKMNEYLQQMVTDLQNLLSLITRVNQAFKDAQTQMLKDNPNDNQPNFGWDTKSIGNKDPDKDHKKVDPQDMVGLLNEMGEKWKGQVQKNSQTGEIELCFYTPPEAGKDGPPPNPLLVQYFGATSDQKCFVGQKGLTDVLKALGTQMEQIVGGNIASTNEKGFADVNTVDGLVKSVNSSMENIQSQSGANISKLNLAYQALNSAVSNLITLLSNVQSSYQKLCAV
ncbi:MAG: hypothetical protein V4591_06350 [Bdellovibrionota bacterium]